MNNMTVGRVPGCWSSVVPQQKGEGGFCHNVNDLAGATGLLPWCRALHLAQSAREQTLMAAAFLFRRSIGKRGKVALHLAAEAQRRIHGGNHHIVPGKRWEEQTYEHKSR